METRPGRLRRLLRRRGPQQFHLDFGVADLDRAQEQVLALGATVLDDRAGGRVWRIYADPAGHPFCLVRR